MTDTHNAPESFEVDLTNCDREPIHILGNVQSYGCLVAVSTDWITIHASVNVSRYLGVEADDIIGLPFRDIIADKALHDIRTRLQLLSGEDAIERIFGLKLLEGSSELFDVSMHVSNATIILEFERSNTEGTIDSGLYVRPMINRIKSAHSVVDLCHAGARQIKALTGFDRVMVYKFLPDDTGEVIAEVCRPDMEPYLGLRYPASDIPKQARALYLRSLLRIISDVNGEVYPIIPPTNPEGQPIDLSLSTLRSVSPIHLEYLRNMGVSASMSISILKKGKLWGLFSCHHTEPRVLSYDIRSAAELFAQLFSFVLDQKETELEQNELVRARAHHDQLMSRLADGKTLSENFSSVVESLREVVPCDGIAAWIDGRFQQVGKTPTEEEFTKLVRFLNTATASKIYSTECLGDIFPPAKDYVVRGAGLLAMPVSRTPRDYIVLFRQEIAKSIKWGGNPDKPVEPGPNGIRLTPRKSFEAWQEVVRGNCASWTSAEIGAAESLRVTLLEVVLRLTDAANQERQQNQERQELLISELNHRVRNILNLIRGLVSQSKSDAKTVEQFTETVGGRVHALARAHDQITKENWNGASLRGLIQTECDAYFAEKSGRVTINGPEIDLSPEAFSTCALVIHELVTNSAKYGALSDSRGRIIVEIDLADDGALLMNWTEEDGPPVKPPTRRGFGSTVIERSIPYELKGKAKISYNLSGLSANFMIPSVHVESVSSAAPSAQQAKPSNKNAPSNRSDEANVLSGHVLLVEDNMIIALDAEDMLKELGAKTVTTASSVSEGLQALEQKKPDFAVLDVNLGAETSKPVAKVLAELGVPFIFTTGYGENAPMLAEFEGVAVLQKPYDKDRIKSKLA